MYNLKLERKGIIIKEQMTCGKLELFKYWFKYWSHGWKVTIN